MESQVKPEWDLRSYKNGTILHLRVQTNARKNGINPGTNGMVRLMVTASPIKETANKDCIKFLSSFFKISKSRIEIIRGSTSKVKWLWFKNVDPPTLSKILDKEFPL